MSHLTIGRIIRETSEIGLILSFRWTWLKWPCYLWSAEANAKGDDADNIVRCDFNAKISTKTGRPNAKKSHFQISGVDRVFNTFRSINDTTF
jgi:hypothetical protein